MIREIKFRAWDKKEKVMLLPGEGWEVNNEYGALSFPVKEPEKTYWIPFGCGAERFELMQYTGLKDVSGVEIFDGDICEDIGATIYQITWVADAAKFGAKIIKSDYVLPIGCTFPLQHYVNRADTTKCGFEVIGNIYANPELLEG